MTKKKTVRNNASMAVIGKETGSARVYSELRRNILSMSLPPSYPLDEVSLSQHFNLSRSPIREALVRLASEGLVLTLPNRSTIVAPLDFRSVPEYLDALDLLQRATHRSAAVCRSDEELKEVEEADRSCSLAAQESYESGEWLAIIEGNYNFHMTIARAGRNQYLSSFYKRVLDEGRRMLYFHNEFLSKSLGTTADRLNLGHAEIVEAIRDRNADRAEQLAYEHASQFKGTFLEYLEQSVTSKVKIVMA
ncbi:GntR family transcriptional regulator [Mesorhizobium sophorae]|uniref:GntR family transcriptional regulator n=1 Tax=Mesorhizobium sophorae TaxID=1300294 RepID=UPI001FDA54F2|nr:GntR family transcriptional regulator [Mesorhizobium sophorae]